MPTYHAQIKVDITYTDKDGNESDWYSGPLGSHLQIWKWTDNRNLTESQVCFAMRQRAVKALLGMADSYSFKLHPLNRPGNDPFGSIKFKVGKCELVAIT